MSVEVLKNVYFICLSGKRKSCLYKNNEVFNWWYVMEEVYLWFNCVNVKLIYVNFCGLIFLN